jgi:hypothetical protein
MSRNQVFVVLILYVLGAAASVAWAVSIWGPPTWSPSGLLGLLLWTSFYAFCNVVGWMAYWSREHWMG